MHSVERGRKHSLVGHGHAAVSSVSPPCLDLGTHTHVPCVFQATRPRFRLRLTMQGPAPLTTRLEAGLEIILIVFLNMEIFMRPQIKAAPVQGL